MKQSNRVSTFIPTCYDLFAAQETVQDVYINEPNKENKRRKSVVVGLHICADEIYSLTVQYPKVDISLIPETLLDGLQLTEEQYLNYPIEELEQYLWGLQHHLREIQMIYHIEEIDLDFMLRYIPKPIWFISRTISERYAHIAPYQHSDHYSMMEHLERDQLYRLRWLATSVPYFGEAPKRPMMELVTFATGLVTVKEGIPTYDEQAIHPEFQAELAANPAYQNLVNAHTWQAFGLVWNQDSKTFETAYHNPAPPHYRTASEGPVR